MVKKQGLALRNEATKGFTLIEMIVTLAVVGLVGGAASIIFFTTLRNANKSDVIREVKQNGEYAISVMERMIRSATAVKSCSANSLTITNPDNQPTTFSLSGIQIASNSGMSTDANKVAASNLFFTCTKTSGKPDVVVVKFDLSQAVSPTRPEERASMTFQTTVSLRTY